MKHVFSFPWISAKVLFLAGSLIVVLGGCEVLEIEIPQLSSPDYLVKEDSIFFSLHISPGNSPVLEAGIVVTTHYPDSKNINSPGHKIPLFNPGDCKGNCSLGVVNKFTDDSTYYFWAYLVNGNGSYFSEVSSFDGLGKQQIEVTKVEPTNGYAGDYVKIYGNHFGGATDTVNVYFDGVKAVIVSRSMERLVVEIPEYLATDTVGISIQRNASSVLALENFTLNGPTVLSVSQERVENLIDLKLSGLNFASPYWRNKIFIFRDEYNPPCEDYWRTTYSYEVDVLSASSTEISGVLDVTNILPGSWNILVSSEELFTMPGTKMSVSSPWKSLNPKPGAGLTQSALFKIGNKIYATAGTSNWINLSSYSNECWSYDLDADEWSRAANLPGRLNSNTFGFSIVGFSVGSMGYIYQTTQTSLLDSVWRYSALDDEWSILPPVSFDAPSEVLYGFSHKNKGYIIKHDKSFLEFDPANGTWSRLPDFEGNSRSFAGVSVMNDKLYLIGGHDPSHHFPSDSWSYDFLSQSWRSMGLIDFQVQGVVQSDSRVYIFKAVTNPFLHNETHLVEFDPEKGEIVESFPFFPGDARARPGMAAYHNGSIFFGLGSCGGYGDTLTDMWKIEIN